MSDYRPMVWPDWVVTEDSDVVWIRHDVGPDVIAEARSCTTEQGWSMLQFDGMVNMVRGTANPSPGAWDNICGLNYDTPLLHETDDKHDLQDAMRYARWEIVGHWDP